MQKTNSLNHHWIWPWIIAESCWTGHSDSIYHLRDYNIFGTQWWEGTKDIKHDIFIFAAAKLMVKEFVEEFFNNQKVVCLSQQFPIEFNSTNYIQQLKKRTQVEGHMQVCLKINGAFQTMTPSSSKLILLKAAYFLMTWDQSFIAAKVLKSVMESKGEHRVPCAFAVSSCTRCSSQALLFMTTQRKNTASSA